MYYILNKYYFLDFNPYYELKYNAGKSYCKLKNKPALNKNSKVHPLPNQHSLQRQQIFKRDLGILLIH